MKIIDRLLKLGIRVLNDLDTAGQYDKPHSGDGCHDGPEQ